MKTFLAKRLKKEYGSFKKDSAGKRFQRLYRRSRNLPVGFRVICGAMGLILALGGLALGFIPGVPGIVFGVAGIALVAAQFKSVAVGADRSEVALRNFSSDFKSHFQNPWGPGKSRRSHSKRKPARRNAHKSDTAVAA